MVASPGSAPWECPLGVLPHVLRHPVSVPFYRGGGCRPLSHSTGWPPSRQGAHSFCAAGGARGRKPVNSFTDGSRSRESSQARRRIRDCASCESCSPPESAWPHGTRMPTNNMGAKNAKPLGLRRLLFIYVLCKYSVGERANTTIPVAGARVNREKPVGETAVQVLRWGASEYHNSGRWRKGESRKTRWRNSRTSTPLGSERISQFRSLAQG